MATGNFLLDKGYDAGAALTKFRAVKFHATTAETVIPVTAKTDVTCGVAQYGVTTGEIDRGKGASVRGMGATEWEAGGACGQGALAGMMDDGRVHTAVSGDRVVGIFREGAANAGDRASVTLSLPGYVL